LDNEYSDGMLRDFTIAGIPPFTTNWGAIGSAYWTLDTNHVCASAARMIYHVEVEDSELNTIYFLQWHEIWTGMDGTALPPKLKMGVVVGTGSTDQPALGQDILVDVPVKLITITETTPEIVATFSPGSPGGGGPAGTGGVGAGSLVGAGSQ